MSVTISRPDDRRGHSGHHGRPRLPGLPGLPASSRRGLEAALLVLAAGVAIFAMTLTWHVVARPLDDATTALASGELINLNAVTKDAELLAPLSFLATPAERSFVAARIR